MGAISGCEQHELKYSRNSGGCRKIYAPPPFMPVMPINSSVFSEGVKGAAYTYKPKFRVCTSPTFGQAQRYVG